MVGDFDFFLFRLSFAVCAVRFAKIPENPSGQGMVSSRPWNWTTLLKKRMLRWYSSLGLSYLQKSLNKEAIAEVERAVALSPNNRLAVTRSDIGFNDFKHGFLAGLTLRAAGGGGPEGQHMIANMDTSLLGGSARPPLNWGDS